jgi:hypothetical protein
MPLRAHDWGMANDDKMIRLKVEGFDVEGRAVPMTGPLLVLLPGDDWVRPEKIVALQSALPAGSIVASGLGEAGRAVELLSHVEDHVMVEAMKRRGFALAHVPDEHLVEEMKRRGFAVGFQRDDDEPEGGEVQAIRIALSMVMTEAPPRAVIRDWSSDQRATVKAWANAYYRWVSFQSEDGREPPQPACLARALDFLANGVIKLGAT